AAFHDALDEAERSSARVIVIGHAPPVFCAGADLGERTAGISSSEAMGRLFERLMASKVPTIAAVQGSVRAGGMGVMTACDLVVVQRDVAFAFTEVRLGVVPAMIAIPVLRRTTWSAMVAPFLTASNSMRRTRCAVASSR